MLIAGVLCLCAAIAAAALGLWTLSRPHTADPAHRVRRAIAPTQLAASVMLGAGGTVALAAGARTGPLVLIVGVLGAIGTVAAGSWQAARFAVEHVAEPAQCSGSCASCSLSCQ